MCDHAAGWPRAARTHTHAHNRSERGLFSRAAPESGSRAHRGGCVDAWIGPRNINQTRRDHHRCRAAAVTDATLVCLGREQWHQRNAIDDDAQRQRGREGAGKKRENRDVEILVAQVNHCSFEMQLIEGLKCCKYKFC